MGFLAVSLAVVLVVAGVLLRSAFRTRAGMADAPAAHDLALYREQLADVERDLARGVLSAEDAAQVRVEVSRRMLAADAELRATKVGSNVPRTANIAMGAALVALLLAGSFLLYQRLGAIGFADLPRAERLANARARSESRPTQAEFEKRLAPLPPADTSAIPEAVKTQIVTLRATVAERPDDLWGNQLLAENEAALGNMRAAYEAQANVLRLKGDAATADEHLMMAELMIGQARGYVSPEAQTALRVALKLDEEHQAALYYWGLMRAQNGRPDIAFRIWERLLRDSEGAAPWVAPIRSQIERLAEDAGVDFEMPALNGPSAQDIEAAAQASPEARLAMIEGMVAQLSERLATEGGSAEEWARLIVALGVMGEPARATAIYDEALDEFAGKPKALEMIERAATQAGVSQ